MHCRRRFSQANIAAHQNSYTLRSETPPDIPRPFMNNPRTIAGNAFSLAWRRRIKTIRPEISGLRF
jgi:hypothetical protein